MKLWEKVTEKRLRRDISISNNQFGFMGGRSTIEAIHLVRRLMGFYRNRKKDLHVVFVDLEKKDVAIEYAHVTKDMYETANIRAMTLEGDTKDIFWILGCIKDNL